jgi:hypothetical protein
MRIGAEIQCEDLYLELRVRVIRDLVELPQRNEAALIEAALDVDCTRCAYDLISGVGGEDLESYVYAPQLTHERELDNKLILFLPYAIHGNQEDT